MLDMFVELFVPQIVKFDQNIRCHFLFQKIQNLQILKMAKCWKVDFHQKVGALITKLYLSNLSDSNCIVKSMLPSFRICIWFSKLTNLNACDHAPKLRFSSVCLFLFSLLLSSKSLIKHCYLNELFFMLF